MWKGRRRGAGEVSGGVGGGDVEGGGGEWRGWRGVEGGGGAKPLQNNVEIERI